jgi:prophage regulatory protein
MMCLMYRDLAARGIPYSREHLARLIKQGRFPAPFRLNAGGRIVWDEALIDDWLAARAKTAQPEPARQWVRAPRRSLPPPGPMHTPRRTVPVPGARRRLRVSL